MLTSAVLQTVASARAIRGGHSHCCDAGDRFCALIRSRISPSPRYRRELLHKICHGPAMSRLQGRVPAGSDPVVVQGPTSSWRWRPTGCGGLGTRLTAFSSVRRAGRRVRAAQRPAVSSSRSGDGHGGPARCVQTAVRGARRRREPPWVMQASRSAIGPSGPACPRCARRANEHAVRHARRLFAGRFPASRGAC